jgi:hypothetical protein
MAIVIVVVRFFVEHLVGMVEVMTASSCGALAPTTLMAEKSEVDKGLVVVWMALKFASVVIIATSMVSAQPDQMGQKMW